MWLLSTNRAELRFFSDATAVPGGYAILSHTWGRDEQSFQDIKALGEQCKADGTNPRDFVSDKIRGCCILAEYHGYAWAWVDSCCIDKTSSSELSESINSMFQWYTQAEMCYVYMADVRSDCDIYASDSEFRTSRWHTRGWTLQELIASTMVIFLSRDWTFLGKRDEPDVAGLLEDITTIPSSLLMRSTRVHEYSIAMRMSWASRRSTTRIEDEAYCLMGLFDVNMPTIYGEGRRAFQRLQLEIMKNSSDTSIFAWGDRISDASFEAQGLRPYRDWEFDEIEQLEYLLARSPRNFEGGVYFTPAKPNPLQRYPPVNEKNLGLKLKADEGPFNRIELPKFTSTSYGIECRFPIITTDGYTIAVLLCATDCDHLGLLLHEDVSGEDPTRPRYFTSTTFAYTDPSEDEDTWTAKIVTLGSDLYRLRFNGKVVKAAWRTIYIVPSPTNLASPTASFSRLQLERSLGASFRIPHWLIATFAALNFTGDVWDTDSDAAVDSGGVHRIYFHHIWKEERIYVELGLCPHASPSTSISMPWRNPKKSHRLSTHAPWARVHPRSVNDPLPWNNLERLSHDCNEDHIDTWPMRTKIFSNPGGDGVPERAVRISFDPCRVSPGKTLVVHLELLGPMYDEILHDANVLIPTRDALYVGLGGGLTVPATLPLSSTGGISMPPVSIFAAPARVLGSTPTRRKAGPNASGRS